MAKKKNYFEAAMSGDYETSTKVQNRDKITDEKTNTVHNKMNYFEMASATGNSRIADNYARDIASQNRADKQARFEAVKYLQSKNMMPSNSTSGAENEQSITLENRANDVKNKMPNGQYEDIYNTVEARLKERSFGEKATDFMQGNSYKDPETGERISKGKESRIMTILQEEYGMSDREAQNIAQNWGDLEAAENVKKADKWYEEKEKVYESMSEEEKQLLADTFEKANSNNPNSAMPGRKRLHELGYNEADMYEFYRRKLAREENERMQESVQNAGVAKNIGQNALAAGATLIQPLDIIDQAYATLTGTPYDTNLARYTNYKNAVRNESAERLVEATGSELAGKAYGIATSMMDSATAIATGPAALPIMAMDAGANAYVDAIDRGLGEEKAAMIALANGGFEALFEKFSLDHFWNMAKPTARAGLKDSVINIIAQMGIEGSEEVATSIADTIADRVINGNQSEYKNSVRSYMEGGMDEAEAKKTATIDYLKSIAEDFIGGAISGGVFGAGAEVYGTHQYRKITKSMSNESVQKLHEAALTAPEGTTANEIANSKPIEELTENDKVNILKSLSEVAESEPTVIDVLEDALIEEGVSEKDATKQAKQIIEMLKQGEDVSEEEQSRNEELLGKNDAQAHVYGNYLKGDYNNKLSEGNRATEAVRSAQEDYFSQREQKNIESKVRKAVKETGISVVRAVSKDTDAPTAIVGFSDSTEDATLLRAYDSENGAKPVSINDVILPDDVRSIYYNASSLKDTYAANAAVENYKGESATLYNLGVTTAYYTGRNGQISYEQFKANPKNSMIFSGVGEDTLLNMFYLGQNAAEREKKNAKAARSASKTVEERKGTTKGNFKGLEHAVQLHAKKAGVDIEAKKDTEHGANGYFAPSVMKIVLNENANMYQTLMHETNEFADTYNPEGMKKVYDSVIAFLETERGASYVAQMGRDYLERYRAINKDETYREALEEFSNDVIGAMFSTDEGIHEYMEWLNNDSGMNTEERKSIIESILEFFQKLFDSIKDYVDNHNLNRNTERVLESSEEKLSHIRQQVLNEWNQAIENSKGKVAPVQQEEKRFSLQINDDGNKIVVIDENILDGVSQKDVFETVREFIKNKFIDGYIVNGFTVKNNSVGRKEFISSKDSKYLRINYNDIFIDKMKAANNLDEIIENADKYSYEMPDHMRKDDIQGFVRGKINIKIDNNEYTAEVILADSKKKGVFFYDLINLDKKIKEAIQPADIVKTVPESRIASKDSISRNEENAIDTDRNNLSKEQNEYSLADYSYNELAKLPDIEVKSVADSGLKQISYSPELTRAEIYKTTHENIKKHNNGGADNVLHNRFIGDVNIGNEGLKHAFRRLNRGQSTNRNISATINIPIYFENAIVVNEAEGLRNGSDEAYVLIGTYKENDGQYFVRIVVNKSSKEMEELKYLYALTTKKEGIVSEDTPDNRIIPSSTIKIADLLEFVKKHFPNELSENVAKELGYKRGESDIEGLKYSLSIDEAWEDVMNGMDEEFVDSSIDFAKGAKYSDLPSILEEGYHSLENVTVNRNEIESIARKLIRKYKSTYSAEEFADNMERVFAFMQENKELQFADLYRVMKEVTEPMIEKSQTYDPVEQEVYRKFLDTFKGQTFKVSEQQAQYLEAMYGESFNKIAFRFGSRVKLSKTKGIELDNVYEQLIEDSGYTLDYGTPEEEAFFITEAIEGLRPQPKLMNGMNTVEQAYDVALEVFNEFYEAQAMDDANAAVRKYIRQVEQKQKLLKEKNELRYKEQLKQIKKQEFDKRQQQAEYYQERLERAEKAKRAAIDAKDREAAEKYKKLEESYRKKYNAIKDKNSDTIDKLLAKNRITANTIRENQERAKVKEQIKKNANAIVSYFNQNTDNKHIQEVLKDPIAGFITAIDFTGAADTKTATEWESKLALMRDRLSKREEAIQNGYGELYDAMHGYTNEELPVIKDMDAFLNAYSGAKITELSTESLQKLNKILRALRTTITNANKLFVNNRTQSASDLGKETIKELEDKKDKMSHTGMVDGVLSVVDAGMMDSRSYFYRMGESGLSIYNGLREAFNNRVWKLRQAQEYMQDVTKSIDVSKWTGDKAKVHTFVINGKELKLTTAQIMSIYELRKRGQAMIHMLYGGIKPTKIGEGKGTIERKKPFKDLTEFDIDNITAVLTNEQKQVADAMQQFMGNQCSEWGNETTMLLYGYERYNAKNYFPISVDGNSVDTKDDTQFFGLKNKGFTKSTVKNAGNALIVGDIFDVFTKHVSEMASYSTFTAPLMDAMKWYNYRDMDYSEDIAKNNGSVKEEIDRVYGNDYLKFFEKLIKDINAESNYDFSESVSKMLTSNMKAAAVGANVRVAIQQPTAIVRATAVMNPKYLAKGVISNPKANVEKAKKYSAITQWKSWGYFETSIGKSMKGIITGEASLKEKITEKSMILAQLGDDITWGYIWQACENEIKDKRHELKYDSEEYLKAVAKRFDEVIDQTQVVDSVLHRSHIMRNQNGAVQMATAFMAEPTKSYNMLANAVRDVHENRRGARKKLARATVAFTATAMVNALAQSLIDALRDNDDDKEFTEKYMQFWNENFKENMNFLAMIPYVKDLFSIAEGYDVSRSDMQGVTYLINGSRQLWKWLENPTDTQGYTYREKHTFYQSFKKVMQGASQVVGIPVYNMIRDIGAFYHTITGKEFGGSVQKRTERYETIAQAYIDDNSEIAEEEIEKLLEFGVPEDRIQKGVRTQMKTMLKEGNISEEQYEDCMKKEYGLSENDAFFETVHALYGSQADFAAVHSAIDATMEEDTTENRKLIISNVQDAIKHGKTKDKVLSSIKSKYKDKYLELKKNGKAANMQNILITALMSAGYTKEEAMNKINSWE